MVRGQEECAGGMGQRRKYSNPTIALMKLDAEVNLSCGVLDSSGTALYLGENLSKSNANRALRRDDNKQ